MNAVVTEEAIQRKKNKDRTYQALKRLNERADQRATRLNLKRAAKANRSEEQKSHEYIRDKKRKMEKLILESPEDKIKRRNHVNKLRNKKLDCETVDQREERLRRKRISQQKARDLDVKPITGEAVYPAKTVKQKNRDRDQEIRKKETKLEMEMEMK